MNVEKESSPTAIQHSQTVGKINARKLSYLLCRYLKSIKLVYIFQVAY